MQRLNFLYLETVPKTIKPRAINELHPPLICYIVTAYPKLPSFAFANECILHEYFTAHLKMQKKNISTYYIKSLVV